jgi:hypothetical protein
MVPCAGRDDKERDVSTDEVLSHGSDGAVTAGDSDEGGLLVEDDSDTIVEVFGLDYLHVVTGEAVLELLDVHLVRSRFRVDEYDAARHPADRSRSVLELDTAGRWWRELDAVGAGTG